MRSMEVLGEKWVVLVPSIIKPLKKWKRSKFKKNYMSTSKRWGKITITQKEK